MTLEIFIHGIIILEQGKLVTPNITGETRCMLIVEFPFNCG
jgi:hypothetical protein